jgi:hypothetical protein
VADQLVFSGLTREQADATKQFHEDNGATAEIIPDGPTLFSVLVAYPASAPADGPTSAFVQNIVGIANRQWDFFGDQTFDLAGRTTLVGHKEGEDGWYQRVGEYWLEGTGTHGVDGRDHNMFWSAAFISWVMKTGGAGDRFRYSTLHSVYIFQAIRDHLQNRTAAGFWAWRLDEIKPKVGDLICWTRQRGIDFDNQNGGNYPGHCDIVVQVFPDRINVIGGNVGNSVTRRPLALDASGFLKPPSSGSEAIIAIMQDRI